MKFYGQNKNKDELTSEAKTLADFRMSYKMDIKRNTIKPLQVNVGMPDQIAVVVEAIKVLWNVNRFREIGFCFLIVVIEFEGV